MSPSHAMHSRISLQGLWSSRLTFILAVTGSAVGLGNIWKFPYIAGQNGGGAFVLIYLACVFGVGLPIMMSEVLIGRRGRRNPVDTMRVLSEEEAGHGNWRVVGAVGIIAAAVILSFYSVIAGWALAYVWKSASGVFVGADSGLVLDIFTDLRSDWRRVAGWHTAFMIMTCWVVARGVQRGLARAVEVLMPVLVVLLLVLAIYSARHGDFTAAATFMFRPDFSSLTPTSALIALGHAFFTLSLGMGALMAYGAYLPEGTPIGATCVVVVLADTAIALLAGLVIFPIVFGNGLDPAEGPGLIFHTLPLAFGQMNFGSVFGALFFVLLAFAGWTSSIGLLEPGAAWLIESRHTSRPLAAAIVGGLIWALGFVTIFSFNLLEDFVFWRGTLFQNLDHLASNYLLPLSGLSITLFAGWVMARNSSAQELDMDTGWRYRSWRFVTRFIAPLAVLVLFASSIGILGWLGRGGA